SSSYSSLARCSVCAEYRLLLYSFPPRRSSDLRTRAVAAAGTAPRQVRAEAGNGHYGRPSCQRPGRRRHSVRCLLPLVLAAEPFQDRKSTRLNSSHQIISYAVFCLKKKNTTKKQ